MSWGDEEWNFFFWLFWQREELEVLGSIYGEDFLLEEEDPPTFTVSIRVNNGELEASLMISFEPEYPKTAPPIYQLSIPWIRGDRKLAINATLEELYLWVLIL